VAEDLTEGVPPGLKPLGEPAAPAPDRAHEKPLLARPPKSDWEPGPHAGRFMVAYGLLGLVLGATVIALAVVLTRGDEPKPVAWSSWKPGDGGTQGVRDIAAHVAQRYRLPSGRQIVAVIPRAPSVMDPPITAAAIDKQALFDKEQQFSTFGLDKSLLFIFCGGGTNCAISEGTPTPQRHRLLRREALELALYTFHYMPDVDSIVTFLPPRLDATAGNNQNATQNALFFRKTQYANFAKSPLVDTLPGRPQGELLSASQAQTVDRLTLPALFRYQLQRSPDGGNAVLVLSPAVTAG
jgi:hypothetical protein